MIRWDGVEFAKGIAWYMSSIGAPVNADMLDEMLYRLDEDAFEEHGETLLDALVTARDHGPQYDDVRRSMAFWGNGPILSSRQPAIASDSAFAPFCDEARRLAGKGIWCLRERSHADGGRWRRVYGDGDGCGKAIAFA